MPSPTIPTRRKPHCQTCQLPMEGHRRQGRTVICPSPPSASSSSRSSLPDEDPGFTPPSSQSSLLTDTSQQSSALSSPPPTPPRRSHLTSELEPQVHTTLINDHSAHVTIGMPHQPTTNTNSSSSSSSSSSNRQPLQAQRHLVRNPSVQAYSPPFEVPAGPWRRRNPNWDSFDELPAVPPQWTAPNPNLHPHHPHGYGRGYGHAEGNHTGPGIYYAPGVSNGVAAESVTSDVPTVLVDDDGNTVLGSLDDDPHRPRQYHVSRQKQARAAATNRRTGNKFGIKQESGEETVDDDWEEEYGAGGAGDQDDAVSLSSSLFDRIARTSSGVIRVVRGRHPSGPIGQDAAAAIGRDRALEIAEGRARRRGVHTGLLHIQNERPGNNSASTSSLRRESSWWMVLGRDKQAVQSIVQAQGKGPTRMPGTMDEGPSRMPGTMNDVVVQNHPVMAASFLQLIFAGIVGGCIVAYALSTMA